MILFDKDLWPHLSKNERFPVPDDPDEDYCIYHILEEEEWEEDEQYWEPYGSGPPDE